ncbi:MAG: ectoine synthase [Alphaproteobacteria bacterium]|nr:ectoine synthase [Alphaproteobacteria bacterium]
MIIKNLNDISGTERQVQWGNGTSHRFLLEKDKMGYGLTHTIVNPGTESHLQYKNHLETCYCISGSGEVEDMDGKVHRIEPGVMYALDQNDEHILRADPDVELHLVCVFNPPLIGTECHDLNGEGSSVYAAHHNG